MSTAITPRFPLKPRPEPPKYSELTMATALAHNFFSDAVVAVDCCQWPGDECDLLVVDQKLRVIEVEIKISRADLRKDREKTKWFRRADWRDPVITEPMDWPRNIWKHYYALPESLWKPELLELCRPMSGVLLVRAGTPRPKYWHVRSVKRATANKAVAPISAGEAIDIARLASLRMWDAYAAAGWGTMCP